MFLFLICRAKVFCCWLEYFFLLKYPSLLHCRKPVLSAGVRLGGHRAQGPGRHQGAAAALISPNASHHLLWPHLGRRRQQEQESPQREKEQEAGELEEEEAQKQGEEQKEEEDSPPHCCPLGKSSLLPPPQLRAAFYSCTPTGNTNQYSSAVTARHLPSPFLPP